MSTRHSRRQLQAALIPLAAMLMLPAFCSGTEISAVFSYQGRLADSGSPADGTYDFEFSLYEDETLPTLLATVTIDDVTVDEGVFQVQLDFGISGLFNGDTRWLEIAVRPGDQCDPGIPGTCDYTVLSARQRITPTPYTIYAVSSGQTTSGSIDGSGSTNQIAKFTDVNTIDDSEIYESGGSVGIGASPQRLLHMKGVNPRMLIEASESSPEVNLKNSDDSMSETWSIYKNSGTDDLEFYQNGTRSAARTILSFIRTEQE